MKRKYSNEVAIHDKQRISKTYESKKHGVYMNDGHMQIPAYMLLISGVSIVSLLLAAGCVKDGKKQTSDGTNGMITQFSTPVPYVTVTETRAAVGDRASQFFQNGYNGCNFKFNGKQKTVSQDGSKCIVKNATDIYCVQDAETTNKRDFTLFFRGCQIGRGDANIAYEGAKYGDIVRAHYFIDTGVDGKFLLYDSEYYIQEKLPDIIAI